MRKLGVFLTAIVSFACIFCGKVSVTAKAEGKSVYVGGIAAGFTLTTGDVQIIGICDVIGENGVASPAHSAGLKSGDFIRKINGEKVEKVSELNESIHKSCGKEISIEIERNKERFDCKITPVKDKASGRYKIGVLLKDSVSGIGTITYIDKENNRFGALGHSVSNESENKRKIFGGSVFSCAIVGIDKGVRGRAGELRGMFIGDQKIGETDTICDCGIFGTVAENLNTDDFISANADSCGAKIGSAYIYTTINGTEPKKYTIEIVKVDKNNKENKNYVVKINDKELLADTGGIVQGMSGSPILQNGKLIGAITHVFLNDPSRGFGIDIQTMLQEK